MGDMLPVSFDTKRLLIKNAALSDCEDLQRICDAGAYIAAWTGDQLPIDHIRTCLTKGDLPPIPGADFKWYTLKSVLVKNTMKPIGYLDLYHGYPDRDTLWLSMLLIHPDYQRQSYGREIVASLADEALKASYRSIGIGVHLKNWPALHFWVKQGYDQITGIYGDKVLNDQAFALVGLKKQLSGQRETA